MRHLNRLCGADLAVGAGIAAVYVASRLALVWRFPPHVDESLFATFALNGFKTADARFEPLASGQRPLLEWLGMGVMKLGVEPLTSLRLISVAAGLGTLVLVGYLGWRVGGRHTAWVAAGLFTVLPFFVVYSVVGLYDPLATFLVTAAFVLSLLLAERPTLGVALLLGAVLGAGLLTKLTTETGYVALPASALFFDWNGSTRRSRLARWLGLVLCTLVVSWAIYQVLKLTDLYRVLGRTQALLLARHSLTTFLKHPWHWIDTNGSSYGPALLGYVTIPVLLALVVGVVAAIRTRLRLFVYLTVWAAVPLSAAVALADVPYIRWLAVGLPPITVLGALGIVTVAREIPRRFRTLWPRFAVTGLLVAALLLPMLTWDGRTLASPTSRQYPGHDDLDFVREYSAGGPWLKLAPDIRRLAGGRRVQVAFAGAGTYYVPLALRHDTNIELVDSGSSSVAGTLYGFENAGSLTAGNGLGWRLLRTYPRSRGGVSVTLYQHGAVYDGRFAGTPDDLRRLIGGTDKDFDRFGDTHPAVKIWLNAWYTAYPS
jgi:4-amino-4-deoxy-L-arabinose transferase-like glycosyltransferase